MFSSDSSAFSHFIQLEKLTKEQGERPFPIQRSPGCKRHGPEVCLPGRAHAVF